MKIMYLSSFQNPYAVLCGTILDIQNVRLSVNKNLRSFEWSVSHAKPSDHVESSVQVV